MADIYLAAARGALGFSKLVVLKHLRSYEDEQRSLDMFLDEARLAARLKHPNIVDTYDVGQDGDSYFIAMEYLEGQSLSRILRAVHPNQIPPSAWARVVVEALRGLHHAHELRDYDGMPLEIVHRDISPPNIFVTYGGEIKIVDFGIAKATLNTFQTEPGVLKGKLGYMAPEQSDGRPVDRRTDIFSMGVVLWEALVGRRLLENGIRHFVDGSKPSALPTVVSVKPDVDARLSRVVERALAFEPGDRYETAADMSEALEAYLLDVPNPMSKLDIGRVVESLFAEHRASVQRQIETHLAAADRAVVEGEFWASSGIVVAGDGHTNLGFPRPSAGVTRRDVALAWPAAHTSPSTRPHALSDSWAPAAPPRKAPVARKVMLAGGAAIALFGAWFVLHLVHAKGPAASTASLAPATSALGIAAPQVMAPTGVAPSWSPPTRVDSDVSTSGSRTGRRAPARNKRLRSIASETTAAPEEATAAPPAVVAPAAVAPAAVASPEAPALSAVAAQAATPAAPLPTSSKSAPPSSITAAAAEPLAPAGAVDPKEVAATVRAHAGEVRSCWDRARMDHPDLHGRLTVQARISPAGRVLSASPSSTVENGAHLAACVTTAFQKWTFPAPVGGINGNVSYSFVFE